MAVGLKEPEGIIRIRGLRWGVARAGIRYQDRDDLALAELRPGATTAAVFTRNAFRAAPVVVAEEHLAAGPPRYLLVNAGNANAGTGPRGLEDARFCCRALAAQAGCRTEEVLPFSTGVIGEPLPATNMATALPAALDTLTEDGWAAAARAVMTTDTVPKAVSRQELVRDGTITVTGLAKGSGMIRPDMATMLAFVATDLRVPEDLLRRCLKDAVERSFHRITVDGDTSTNDAVVLVATGAHGGLRVDSPESESYRGLAAAVEAVCTELAQAVVRDAEGATRFLTVRVSGGRDRAECLAVAWAIAHSPLVKTAAFAGDPNWGRILAAVGRAGLADLDIPAVRIRLDEELVVEGGAAAATYTEARGAEVMARPEYTIHVELGRGDAEERVWTSDLSHDYVRINAEYRT